VVKRSGGPAGGDGDRRTRDERAALERIRPRLDAETAAALPRDLGGGTESCVPGVSMARRMALWGTPRRERTGDLHRAAGWLTRFHRQAGVERRGWSGPDTRAWIDQPLAAFRGFDPEDRRIARLAEAARRRAAELAGADLPIVWCHRDFTPWNLFASTDSPALTGVIDWEGARPGPALCDLLHFATHWHEGARRAFTPEARRRAFLDLFARRRGAEAEAAGNAIARYCQALRMDIRLLPLLLLFTRVEIVTRRLERTDRSSAGAGRPEADELWLDSDAAYVGWLAESFEEVVAAWR
jgi:aminoglycoside phosphotransferase (APT) family kinase protein